MGVTLNCWKNGEKKRRLVKERLVNLPQTPLFLFWYGFCTCIQILLGQTFYCFLEGIMYIYLRLETTFNRWVKTKF